MDTANTTTSPAAETPKPSPFVDAFFVQTAKALEATSRGLEASAKWLDARAKDVSGFAQKLNAKPAASSATSSS